MEGFSVQWVDEKIRTPSLGRIYPNNDVEINSSEIVANDNTIDVHVFFCQRLTQSSLNQSSSIQGCEDYNHPFGLFNIIWKKFNQNLWHRGTHPSNIASIIRSGIEQEDEYFAVQKSDFSKCLEYGNTRLLDFEKVGKLITIYKADAFKDDSRGDPSNFYKVMPSVQSNIRQCLVGIRPFTSMAQADNVHTIIASHNIVKFSMKEYLKSIFSSIRARAP